MGTIRTREMRSTSLSSVLTEQYGVQEDEEFQTTVSQQPVLRRSPRRDADKLGDPGPSSCESRSRHKRQRLEADQAVVADVLSDDGGEGEATEPLTLSPTSDGRVMQEQGQGVEQSEIAEPVTENSAALQWDDGDEAHAMQVEQGPLTTTALAALEVDYAHEEVVQPFDYTTIDSFARFDYEAEDEDASSYHSGDTEDYELEHRPWTERPLIKRDILDLVQSVRTLARDYKVVDRLGEGTFSSVYLAIDKRYSKYRDDYHRGCLSPQTRRNLEADPRAKVYVALKRIYITSSPQRIQNEIEILESLRGCRNVSQLITAFREGGKVVVSMPYHRNDDFRHFYRLMDTEHIASYMLCLMRGLRDIHARGIIHRDVKPANFLYDYETQRGVLVDFGLAQRYEPSWRTPTCQHGPATLTGLHGTKLKSKTASRAEQAVYNARKRAKLGDGRVGFLSDDKRPSIKTNRAGTRGFRAPEVLLKCPDQTVAIDVWSAGIMLLSILTQRFPCFNSNDDIEALMELAAVFGRSSMERTALLHSRTIITNVPTVDQPVEELKHIVLKLNPNLYVPRCSPTPTPAEAKEHITAIDGALDLLKLCLHLDATKRITAENALMHPFLANATPALIAAERADRVSWGKIKLENDQWRRDERGIPPRFETCAPLHQDTHDGEENLIIASESRIARFGMGIIDPVTGFCPEHEQADLYDVWGDHDLELEENGYLDAYEYEEE